MLCTDDPDRAFEDIDYALLVGSQPRGPGMERSDLIRVNGENFAKTGKSLNNFARPCAKVVVVGNPCNTNCLIAANNAPNIPAGNFSAMTRLDHDRGLGQLAKKAKCSVKDISNFCIWGNHSPTMYPDISNARDWELGTNGSRQSMAVLSNGEYGIAKGLYYSFPVTTADSNYKIVEGLPVTQFSEEKMKATEKELLKERDVV